MAAALGACADGPPRTPPAESPVAAAPAVAAPPASAATPAPPAVPAAASAVAAADAPAVVPCAIAPLRPTIVAAVNAQRAKPRRCGKLGTFAAAPPLTWNDTLQTATQAHARAMATTYRFSHLGPDGRGFDQRVNATGYDWSAVAENIGLGYESVDEVVRAWMASDAHCANLMKPDMRDMAASCMLAADGVPYWALDLAAPRARR